MGKRTKYYKKYGLIKLIREAVYIEPIRLREMIAQCCRPSKVNWHKSRMLFPDDVEY